MPLDEIWFWIDGALWLKSQTPDTYSEGDA